MQCSLQELKIVIQNIKRDVAFMIGIEIYRENTLTKIEERNKTDLINVNKRSKVRCPKQNKQICDALINRTQMGLCQKLQKLREKTLLIGADIITHLCQ